MSESINRSLPDSEFDVLPKEKRRDATNIKAGIEVRLELVYHHQKARNILGGAALAVAAILGTAEAIHEIPLAPEVAIVAADSLVLGAAISAQRESQHERNAATFHAGSVADMFAARQLEPPVWTQDPYNLLVPHTPSQ